MVTGDHLFSVGHHLLSKAATDILSQPKKLEIILEISTSLGPQSYHNLKGLGFLDMAVMGTIYKTNSGTLGEWS